MATSKRNREFLDRVASIWYALDRILPFAVSSSGDETARREAIAYAEEALRRMNRSRRRGAPVTRAAIRAAVADAATLHAARGRELAEEWAARAADLPEVAGIVQDLRVIAAHLERAAARVQTPPRRKRVNVDLLDGRHITVDRGKD